MSHTFFDRNQNLLINGDVNFISNGRSTRDDPSYLAITQRVQAANSQARAIEHGFKILCDNTAPSARYGYGHSFKGPQCHPGTRIAVQDHIFKWFDDENGEVAMWMHGPVGIGKSAIAQSVARQVAERDQLSSAFFFFRSDNTRNTEKHLVATLAYEMTQQMPRTHDHVCQTIASNPLIFSSPLEHQIESTLLRPARSTPESSPRYRLVVIDGLDECLDVHTQQAIIRSFMSTLLSMADAGTTPYKILIASRPESHITSVFSAANISPHVKRLALDSWSMEDDIQNFLRAELNEIRQMHPLRHYLPDVWPDKRSFYTLLDRSVGSFAYASAAIRHLSSQDNNPEYALRHVLSIRSTQGAAAFTDLDALYRHILTSLDQKLRFILQKFLCLYVYSLARYATNPIRSYATALSEDCSIVELVLLRVSSLIKIDKDNESISFHHTSFHEFLCNNARSGDLYAFSPNVVSAVVAALSNLWLHPISDESGYEWFHYLVPNTALGLSRPWRRMNCQILNALVETGLPTSFLYPCMVGVPEKIPQVAKFASLNHVLEFCKRLHRQLNREPDLSSWDSADDAVFNKAFNVVCAWLRSHLDIFFQGAPAAQVIIDFLLGDQWSGCGGAIYESPSFEIFRRLVAKENKSLLSSCICRVFPDMEYTDICHGIIDRYIALSSNLRETDVHETEESWFKENITLTRLYLMVLYHDKPTIPSVCQRLERIVSAGQIALGPVMGLRLTSRDCGFRFFYGDRCYMDSNDQLAIGGNKVSDIMQNWFPPNFVDQKLCEIVEKTDLYIHRAHAENDFAYISADVETICKIPPPVPTDWSSFFALGPSFFTLGTSSLAIETKAL